MDKTFCNQSESQRFCYYRILVFLAILILYSCNSKPEEIRVLFVGDILLARQVKAEYTAHKDFPWEHLKPVFDAADVVIGNLEGAVGKQDEAVNKNNPAPVFAIDSADVQMLAKAGFKAVTTENNHAFDLGLQGKKNTVAALLKNRVDPVGFESSPYFITIKEVVFSLVAINLVINRDSTRNSLPSLALEQKLRLARKLSDIVIVSIHWGSELLEWPDKAQRKAARWLIAHGADIIIGSHPHVIQKPEMIDGKPVFFSLGNHIFDQKYQATKEGLIAEITVKNGKIYCKGILTRNGHNSFYPEVEQHIDYDLEPVTFKKNQFKVDKFEIRPKWIAEGIFSKTILQAYSNNVNVWNSHAMPLVAISSAGFEGEKDYLLALERHYSDMDYEYNIRPYVYSVDNHGIYARWRGSALAWPLLDAQISPMDEKILCALHRGDSFIRIDTSVKSRRIAAYRWNGFGFSGLNDSVAKKYCACLFE